MQAGQFARIANIALFLSLHVNLDELMSVRDYAGLWIVFAMRAVHVVWLSGPVVNRLGPTLYGALLMAGWSVG